MDGQKDTAPPPPSSSLPSPSRIVALASEEENNEAAIFSSYRLSRFLVGEDSPLSVGLGTTLVYEKWLAFMRKRKGKLSDFSNRHSKSSQCMELGIERSLCSTSPPSISTSIKTSPVVDLVSPQSSDRGPEISLFERLGNATTVDIESNNFSWDTLSSLHHIEHSSSTDYSEDEMTKPLEVTVNSGGVIFFALFDNSISNHLAKESTAVIKFAASRMVTQSERLGYAFAKLLGIQTPQARVIHNSSPEWQKLKNAVERARDISVGQDQTCSELLEALDLSRCLLLMNYVHGLPLLDTPNIFDTRGVVEKTVDSLGRILMLDLIVRNEDRLPCRQLGWRGNSANLLFMDKSAIANMDVPEENNSNYDTGIFLSPNAERRSSSLDGTVTPIDLVSENSITLDDVTNFETVGKNKSNEDFCVVVIDSAVPRRPPAGKRAKDQTSYPKLVELLLNNVAYSSNLLFEITGGKVGVSSSEEDVNSIADTKSCSNFTQREMIGIIQEFRGGFRGAVRDLQGFHVFLLTIYQKLDGLLRLFVSIINKNSGDVDKDECESSSGCGGVGSPSVGKDNRDYNNDIDIQKTYQRSSSPKYQQHRESPNSTSSSPMTRENWGGRHFKSSFESRNLRLTQKIRDFNKIAKIDGELNKELEQWTEMIKTDVIKLCQENNFNTGFFEGSDCNIAIDAYELKVRLEHILERIALISNASNTERPSLVNDNLFIGGALSARSVYTLEHLGITNIVCLCCDEIGQSDSQYPDLFQYKNFSINDKEDADIGSIIDTACDYIDDVMELGINKKVLVHCFEGKSRSATVVLAYLILRKNLTLSEAWKLLKKVHRRAQPNDGFGRILLELDKKVHGKASMKWQPRRPTMKVCPLCGKNAGLSSSSLKLHLQKLHPRFSSGSLDSVLSMDIQRTIDTLKINHSGGNNVKKISELSC